MLKDDLNFTPNPEATEALKKTFDMWLAKNAPEDPIIYKGEQQ